MLFPVMMNMNRFIISVSLLVSQPTAKPQTVGQAVPSFYEFSSLPRQNPPRFFFLRTQSEPFDRPWPSSKAPSAASSAPKGAGDSRSWAAGGFVFEPSFAERPHIPYRFRYLFIDLHPCHFDCFLQIMGHNITSYSQYKPSPTENQYLRQRRPGQPGP